LDTGAAGKFPTLLLGTADVFRKVIAMVYDLRSLVERA
jgi:hypothetical protein